MRKQVLGAILFFLLSAPLAAQSDMYDGRPQFKEGVELGYFVWHDGVNWHLRWTTRGVMRRFTGSVSADGGDLKSLKRVDVESETRVLYPGRPSRVVVGPRGRSRVVGGRAPVVARRDQDRIEMDGDSRIRFNALTNDDIDGFDFKVDNKVETLRIVLTVDNRPMPDVVEAGKDNQHPGSLPLVIHLK
jgi:hypothetical protein